MFEVLRRIHTHREAEDAGKKQWDGVVAGLCAEDGGLWGNEEVKTLDVVLVDPDDAPNAYWKGIFEMIEAELNVMKDMGNPNPKIVTPFKPAAVDEEDRGPRSALSFAPDEVKLTAREVADIKDNKVESPRTERGKTKLAIRTEAVGLER